MQNTASLCKTLQRTASSDTDMRNVSKETTHCNICNMLQHTATHCDTLYHTATHCNTLRHTKLVEIHAQYVSKKTAHCYTTQHCNTMQHTATHCNTLQHTATHCIRRHRYVECVKRDRTLRHTASHCITLQHSATHCKTP